jgi:nucleoside 2-deoxyribosyltransferase
MQMVVDALNKASHDAYCPVFDQIKIQLQAKDATKEIFDYAFQNIAKCDGMVAIVTSDRKSEGQLMEIGALLAQTKPLFLFIHESAKNSTHLPKLAAKTFTWKTEQDLQSQLANV